VFERRLKVLLALLSAAVLVIFVRLVDLQIVHGSYYKERAARTLLQRPQTLPFVRGSVLDRTGRRLLWDAPCWDIRIDYSIIALDKPRYLKQHIRRWRRNQRYGEGMSAAQVERALRADLHQMWRDLVDFASVDAPVTLDEMRERAREIKRRVEGVRAAVARRNGFEMDVAEERMAHTIIGGLDQQRQIAARMFFERYPWVRVAPAKQRAFGSDGTPFAHILGRMGQVDAADLENDPHAEDRLARYLANDRRGISGVEYVAEQTLRGRRGRIVSDRQERIVEDEPAVDGRDVTLTLSAELQRRLYALLDEELRHVPLSSGGAIVVLDVASREVLALVSYPSYDPSRFNELFPWLRDNTERMPLRFRAVANRYAPGSIMKPLVCLYGLSNGTITVNSEVDCTGYLFPDVRDKWRCWQIHGTNIRKAHGPTSVVQALRESCNVFMYRLGEDLGIDNLCGAFDMVGIGRPAGTGLREENAGINPTPDFLNDELDRAVTRAHPRLFAVGQGELALTPVQVANLVATYANGRWREVTLIRSERERPEWILPGEPGHWSAVRRGLYEVVNDPAGTAHKTACFVHDRYVLCGKTGSATAFPWPTAYRIPYVDSEGNEEVALVPAGAPGPAIKRFTQEHPGATFDPSEVEKASTWPPMSPPEGERYSHAWFAGYLQAVDADHQPDWSLPSRVAFAVIVEFGGSGGRTSGPIARRIAATILDTFGPELDY